MTSAMTYSLCAFDWGLPESRAVVTMEMSYPQYLIGFGVASTCGIFPPCFTACCLAVTTGYTNTGTKES